MEGIKGLRKKKVKVGKWECVKVRRCLGLFGVDDGEGEDSGAGLDGGEGEEGGAHSVVAFHPAEKFGGD